MPVTTEQQIAEWEDLATYLQGHLWPKKAIPALIADLREARETISKLATQVGAYVLLKDIQGRREEREDKLAEAEKDAHRYRDDSERLTHVLTHGMPANAGGKYWYRDGLLFTTAIDCIDAAIAAQEKP